METSPNAARQITLDQPLARGATADVYLWEEGYVLKLFHRFSLDDIEYERRIARAVHASGVPTPLAGPILQVEGRHGLVYERVDGQSMLAMMQQKPWLLFRYARRLAELQAEMHACSCKAAIPAQHQRLEQKIQRAAALPEQLRADLLTRLAAMPERDRVCHGDFHPGNVLLTSKGEVVIDWIDATSGNPLADVARTTIILLGAAAVGQIPGRLLRLALRLFHAVYLRHYFKLRPGGEQEYRRWLPIVAAARLNEQMPELEGWLVAQAARREA